VLPSQRSLVQALPSSHCAWLVQQPAIGVRRQTPAWQVSPVQLLLSAHCAAAVQGSIQTGAR
jgi:hypothetical protein